MTGRTMDSVARRRVRALCLARPQTEERLSHGEPARFAGGRTLFVRYADHHHDDREAMTVSAGVGAGQPVTSARTRATASARVSGSRA